MNEAAARRKLATIVALDVAGFSARAAADEDGAIDAVGVLRRAVMEAAETYGGRVFNAAGDGFMLEFSTASGAVDAALDLAANYRPPVRVGVHLGEVSEIPGGDLLGHGVNIAARLQEMAPPRGVLISNAVRQALRGRRSAQFRAQGQARLDKMNETVAVFVHAPAGARSRILRRRGLWFAAAAVALAALATGAWFARPLLWPSEPRPLRVSVRALEPIGKDVALSAFATDVSGALRSGLVDAKAQILPSAARGEGDLVLSGLVDQDGSGLRISLVLTDTAANATLWSAEISGPADSRSALSERAAAAAGLVVRCAAASREPRAGPIGPTALALYLKACGLAQEPNATDQVLAIYRQLTIAAPRFAPGWSERAGWAALTSRDGGPQSRALEEEAAQAARTALRLNPRAARAYLALGGLVEPASAWEARDRFLAKAYGIDPSDPSVAEIRSLELVSRGRVSDAALAQAQAVAAAPYSPIDAAQLANVLDSAGRTREAQSVIGAAYRRWPDNSQVLGVRFWLLAWNDRTEEALAALADPGANFFSAPNFAAAWRDVLQARRTGNPADNAGARKAVLALDGLNGLGHEYTSETFEMLVMLGDADDALKLGHRMATNSPGVLPVWLFRSPSRPLQNDPRFLALAERYGLVSYWRRSGNWPDFCQSQDLPYDCRTEAAKLLAGRGRA